MPTLTTITLGNIQFAKKFDVLDLSAPLYNDQILYDKIFPKIPGHLQVEPAFQFVSPPAVGDLYLFDFELAEYGAEFSLDEDQLRLKTSPVDAELIENVTALGSRHCRVTVKPAVWFNDDDSPRVVTLRLYCSLAGQRQSTNSNYGVNLVLLKPGGFPASKIQSPVLTKNSDFTIRVTEINEDPVFPKYHIFDYMGLPSGFSLEPVFRISNARPAANVAIELAPDLGKVFKMDGDDVRVLMRNPPWPDTLSKVEGGDQAVAFSAESAAEKAGETIRTFSFLMELADPVPMLTLASSTPSLAASNTGTDARSCSTSQPPSYPPRPRLTRWPKVHVDPVMIHEPLPTGIP